MTLRIALPDMVSPSYFPVIAAVELGFFEEQDIDATIELVFPVTETYRRLRDGGIDLAAGSAHAPLYVFEDWRGCKLCCALSQNMYWFLVVRTDLAPDSGDLRGLRGLRIGAAPGPVDGLRQMLLQAGIDPETEVRIGPVPGPTARDMSFGVTAAQALAAGTIDGFWANGMGAEIATRSGMGTVVVDARRGGGPTGATDYTFAALVTTDQMIEEKPQDVQGAVRAVRAAQQALQADPRKAEAAAWRYFPAPERGLIADLIARDADFYDPRISELKVDRMNEFARRLGILSAAPVPYQQVVATQLQL